MGNCLVKRLKSAVQNDNLTELGVLKLKYKVVNAPARPTIGTEGILMALSPGTVVNLTNATFTDGSSSKTIESGQNYTLQLDTLNAEFTISVQDKYNRISGIAGTDKVVPTTVQTKDLTYIESLTKLYGNIEGNIKELPNNKFTLLDFTVSDFGNIYGDYSEYVNRVIDDNTGNSINGNMWNFFITKTKLSGDLSITPKNVRNPIIGEPFPKSHRIFNTWTGGRRANSDCVILGCGGDSYFGLKTITDAENFLIDNAACTFDDRTVARNIIIYTENEESYTPTSAAIAAVSTLKTKGMNTISINDYVFS